MAVWIPQARLDGAFVGSCYVTATCSQPASRTNKCLLNFTTMKLEFANQACTLAIFEVL